MRSFTSLLIFKIYFEIWRSRWDLKDTSPTYHCNYQHPIHELEIQPKAFWSYPKDPLRRNVRVFAATLYYTAIINVSYLFILNSLSIYFMLADYSFTDCFGFPELASSERTGQVTVTKELDRQLWMNQLWITCCKAKHRFVPTLLKSKLVRGNTSSVHQTEKWMISDNKNQWQKASFP